MYSLEELERMMFDGSCPAHCDRCNAYVTDAEPDASWEGGEDDMIECPNCGKGTQVESALIRAGLM